MTLDEATDLLDAVRAGWDVSPARIKAALIRTGDIDDGQAVRLERFPGVDIDAVHFRKRPQG